MILTLGTDDRAKEESFWTRGGSVLKFAGGFTTDSSVLLVTLFTEGKLTGPDKVSLEGTASNKVQQSDTTRYFKITIVHNNLENNKKINNYRHDELVF